MNYKEMSRKQLEVLAKSNGLYLPNNLLSVSADSKTVKGEKLGYLTGILYLTPSYKLCPASKIAKCESACLVSAGRGRFNRVQAGRANKTALFETMPELFYEALRRDILKLEKQAAKKGLKYCVRLNGTSDINHINFIKTMPEVQFYDYTKMLKHVELVDYEKHINDSLHNYHLTFSYSGANPKDLKHVVKALDYGVNVAVVFKDKNLPQTFKGLPVISGDNTDLRFLDKPLFKDMPAIIGLYAKGQAKSDTTGFVVDNNIIAKG